MSAVTSTNTTNNVMGQDAFMKMLIAQLKNQDPLNPMDGTQFAVQLAQFTSLEKLTNLNETMKVLPEYLSSFANAQTVNMIGNEAIANGNVIDVSSTSATITYNLPSAIADATIKIYNSNGLLVDSVKVGSQNAGRNSITWYCGDIEAGNYTYDISAVDKNGKSVDVSTLLQGTITGASFKNGSAYLTINGQDVAFSDVLAINKATN